MWLVLAMLHVAPSTLLHALPLLLNAYVPLRAACGVLLVYPLRGCRPACPLVVVHRDATRVKAALSEGSVLLHPKLNPPRCPYNQYVWIAHVPPGLLTRGPSGFFHRSLSIHLFDTYT